MLVKWLREQIGGSGVCHALSCLRAGRRLTHAHDDCELQLFLGGCPCDCVWESGTSSEDVLSRLRCQFAMCQGHDACGRHAVSIQSFPASLPCFNHVARSSACEVPSQGAMLSDVGIIIMTQCASAST